MKSAKAIKKKDNTAEEKIIAAARKLFTRKGYDAVKTRDIAKEAGINMALLHYYYGSKDKLFGIIMAENMKRFLQGIVLIVNNRETNIEEKIDLLVSNYIDMLIARPDMPLFVLNEVRNNPKKYFNRTGFKEFYLAKQIEEAVKSGKIAPVKPVNFMINLLGLTIFPFVARPMIRYNNGISEEHFNKLMLERKKLIPKWIMAILKTKMNISE
jgi:AcrR family transcriptional regulator